MRIPCVALRDFYYDKGTVAKDADCEIEEKDVTVLEMALAVKRKEDEKPAKRQYKRRDMTAEGS